MIELRQTNHELDEDREYRDGMRVAIPRFYRKQILSQSTTVDDMTLLIRDVGTVLSLCSVVEYPCYYWYTTPDVVFLSKWVLLPRMGTPCSQIKPDSLLTPSHWLASLA